MSNFLTDVFGILGAVLGLVILVARTNILEIGKYRLDYVTSYVALGSGCMSSGVLLLAGQKSLYWSDIAVILGALAHLSIQYRPGHK